MSFSQTEISNDWEAILIFDSSEEFMNKWDFFKIICLLDLLGHLPILKSSYIYLKKIFA